MTPLATCCAQRARFRGRVALLDDENTALRARVERLEANGRELVETFHEFFEEPGGETAIGEAVAAFDDLLRRAWGSA